MSAPFHPFFAQTGYPTYQGRGAPFPEAGPSSNSTWHAQSPPGSPEFNNIFEWHTAYKACQRFFLDHGQHGADVQAVAALINIYLPFQRSSNPVATSSVPPNQPAGSTAFNLPWPTPTTPMTSARGQPAPAAVSLIPYIRRLVITGMDRESTLQGFFGNDWRMGVGPLYQCERRNYLFAAKSSGWSKVKSQYDMSPFEAVPFLKPLQLVQLSEIEAAEKLWSQWLAMGDWMLGPRAPDADDHEQHIV